MLSQVVNYLKGELSDDWKILASAKKLERCERTHLIVFPHEAYLGNYFSNNMCNYTYQMWLVTNIEDPETLEKHLETKLEELMKVLRGGNLFQVGKATRGVLADTFHGWLINIDAINF